MKRYNQNNRLKRFFLQLSCFLFAAVMLAGCTKDFEKYNTDRTGISNANLDITTVFKPLQHEIFHNYQTAQNLSADGFSGYMMSPTPFKAAYDLNYFLVDGWDSNGFNDMYTYIMAPVNKIASSGARTLHPDLWAIALIVKVEAMHRVTDKFGPVPYSKVGTSLVSTPYDSQQSIYNQFFLELDTAVNNLQVYTAANPGKTPFLNYDLIFGGDYTKWIKFANSLRLRLAMHIVKVDPATAKLQGEKALAAAGGLMSTPADDAAIQVTTGTSDLYMITHDWGDNRLNASMGSYLVGYKDPRTSIYAAPAADPAVAGTYTGIRIGSALASKNDYEDYASLNTSSTFIPTKSEQIMCAAESWFLKAEAALRGWAGAGDAQSNYEQGVTVSMQQWGANIGSYLSDATSTQAAYTDPKNSANNSPAVSSITIQWDASATNEQKLERIMTQKWLAMFPEGQEAWTEFRRTGYPKLFTVVNNKSNGTIDSQIQIRRLAYPQNEYTTNKTAVTQAVTLLGGPDNGGTRLWWDVNKANF